MIKLPSIAKVARCLREVNKIADDTCDVRLQVYPNGAWALRYGDSGYDQDHTGFWGASSVPGGNRRFRSEDVARNLLAQVRECEVAE